MFKTIVRNTPFTSEVAGDYFYNITGNSYDNDVSFLATLRALIGPRIKEGEYVHLVFDSSSCSANWISQSTPSGIIAEVCRRYDMDFEGQVIVHSLRSNGYDSKDVFAAFEQEFSNFFPGFYRLDKIKAFYRKTFNVDCYVNPQKRTAFLLVDNMDIKRMHYLQVSILAFLPWYFNPEEGLTQNELSLIQSLRESSSEKYELCLAELAKAYNFREERIRKYLKGFENRFERLECDKVRSKIEVAEAKIYELNNQISDYLKTRNNLNIQLLGLEAKINSGESEDSEIMEYFMCNKHLILEQVTDREMRFGVKDYLEYFDREIAERAIDNGNSYVYNTVPLNSLQREKLKLLMKEIFVNEDTRMKIRFCAAYRFELNGNVSTQSSHTFDPCEYGGYMPNPHINQYNCMGNYVRTINSLLMDRNYIGALEQCIASCKSLNFGDSVVMSEFMREFLSGNWLYRCIELPDGQVVSPSEAIKWLEEQDKVKEEAENE